MRLTSFGIAFVLMTSFLVSLTSAQIPERVLFQPGSYAYGPYLARNAEVAQIAVLPSAPLVSHEVSEESVSGEATTGTNDDTDKAEWEETFGGDDAAEENIGIEEAWERITFPTQVFIETVPYLAYHRNPWTHRIHVVPYEPGYAAEPESFPIHQSQLNLLLSSLPCRVQDRPQIKYASYYDPDPVIIDDKPSRLQLILGYPNGTWTSCCANRWGYRLAQCPGVEPVPMGSYAEISVKDQSLLPEQSTGIFVGPQPIDSTAQPRRGFRGLRPAVCPPPYPSVYPYQVTEPRSSYLNVQPVQPSIPYPPHTAQSIFHSRKAAVPCSDCASQVDQTDLPCTCCDSEKDCDSCKYCKHCKSYGRCQSCESDDCNHCGTAKTIRCPFKRAKLKKETVTASSVKTSCNTKKTEKD